MTKFKIKKEDEKKRLDIFLKEKYPNLSRSQLQKQIKEGNVLVNKDNSAVHRFLKVGDVVSVEICGSAADSSADKTHNTFNADNDNKVSALDNLDVISETDDYIIINKHCGLIVHPGDLKEKNTLAHILWDRYPEIKDVGEYPERPGIVHRLDKDVSGIMVIVKNQEMFMHLKKQFQERKINKDYIALVFGLVGKPDGVINFPVGRSMSNRTKMAARPLNQGGREAITEFTVLKHLAKWTILSVKIKTGRTHQIRVHLNAYGHPVVGDKIYKPRKLKSTLKFGERMMLHSWKLGFSDLKGEWKDFEADLPEEFKKII